MSAALDQVSPFTFDSRGDSREVAASLSLSAQGETPLSPTPSTNVDLLLGMLQSSTLEAKAEAFCALSDLASHPSSGSFVVQRIFAQSAPLLPCIEVLSYLNCYSALFRNIFSSISIIIYRVR
jgi:hypothetical protein